jgi:hypothetical protein
MDVTEIENAIASLPPTKVAELAKWFAEFQTQFWDRQIEQDLRTGRLEFLLAEAKQDLECSYCEPL